MSPYKTLSARPSSFNVSHETIGINRDTPSRPAQSTLKLRKGGGKWSISHISHICGEEQHDSEDWLTWSCPFQQKSRDKKTEAFKFAKGN